MAEKLGSYVQYLETNQAEDSPEEMRRYFAALHLYRVALAEEHGMTPDQFHESFRKHSPDKDQQPSEQDQQSIAA